MSFLVVLCVRSCLFPPIPVLDVPVVVDSGGEEVVIALETLADFVGVDTLLKIEARKIFTKDVLDVRVGFVEGNSRGGLLRCVDPLVHVGAVVAVVVLALHAVGCGRDLVRMELVDRCLLYTSDAADDLLSIDLGGRRIIKKKKTKYTTK